MAAAGEARRAFEAQSGGFAVLDAFVPGPTSSWDGSAELRVASGSDLKHAASAQGATRIGPVEAIFDTNALTLSLIRYNDDGTGEIVAALRVAAAAAPWKEGAPTAEARDVVAHVPVLGAAGVAVLTLRLGSPQEASRLAAAAANAMEIAWLEPLTLSARHKFGVSRSAQLPRPPKRGDHNPHLRRVPPKAPKVEEFLPPHLKGTVRLPSIEELRRSAKESETRPQHPSTPAQPAITTKRAHNARGRPKKARKRQAKAPAPARADGASGGVPLADPALSSVPTAPHMVQSIVANQVCHYCRQGREALVRCHSCHAYCSYCLAHPFQVDFHAVRCGGLLYECPACHCRCNCSACTSNVGALDAKQPSAPAAASVRDALPGQSVPTSSANGASSASLTAAFLVSEPEAIDPTASAIMAGLGTAATAVSSNSGGPISVASPRGSQRVDYGAGAGAGGAPGGFPAFSTGFPLAAPTAPRGQRSPKRAKSPRRRRADPSPNDAVQPETPEKYGAQRISRKERIKARQARVEAQASVVEVVAPNFGLIEKGSVSFAGFPVVCSSGRSLRRKTTLRYYDTFDERGGGDILSVLEETGQPPRFGEARDDDAAVASAAEKHKATDVPCILCGKTGLIGESGHRVHHIVPCSDTGVALYLCPPCRTRVMDTRADAAKHGTDSSLLSVGVHHEDLCGVCATALSREQGDLTSCAARNCVRAMCESCFHRDDIVTPAHRELHKTLHPQDFWLCGPCVVAGRVFYGRLGLDLDETNALLRVANPPAGSTYEQVVNKVQQKEVPMGKVGPFRRPREVEMATARAAERKRLERRKREQAADQAASPPAAAGVKRPVPDDFVDSGAVSRPRPSVEPATLAYFSNYLNYLLRNRKALPEILPKAELKKLGSEDACFLCKDGGELLECDYQAPNCARCPKVFHEACLGFKVETERWNCPRHYCGACGKYAFQMCTLCPMAYCRDHMLKSATSVNQVDKRYEDVNEGPEVTHTKTEILCPTCEVMVRKALEAGADTGKVAGLDAAAVPIPPPQTSQAPLPAVALPPAPALPPSTQPPLSMAPVYAPSSGAVGPSRDMLASGGAGGGGGVDFGAAFGARNPFDVPAGTAESDLLAAAFAANLVSPPTFDQQFADSTLR